MASLRIRRVIAAAFATAAVSACVDWNPPFADESLRIAEPKLKAVLLDAPPAPADPPDSPSRALFHRINADRAAAGRSPVGWDRAAADLAAAYTRAQILDDTMGHFLTDGFPPYARAARRGIFGFGSENAASFSASRGVIEDSAIELLLKAEEEMVHERPPNDGHRRTILDPDATQVGFGWSQSPTEFRMVEEFFCRRFSWLSVAAVGEDAGVVIRGAAIKGEELEYIGVTREPIPKAVSRTELLRRRTYSYPDPERTVTAANSPSTYGGLRAERLLTLSFERRFSLHYQMDKPGLWTFVFVFRHGGSSAPPRPGGSISLLVVNRKP